MFGAAPGASIAGPAIHAGETVTGLPAPVLQADWRAYPHRHKRGTAATASNTRAANGGGQAAQRSAAQTAPDDGDADQDFSRDFEP